MDVLGARTILAADHQARKGSNDGDRAHEDGPQPSRFNRRGFLQRAAALGLIVAAPVPLQRFWALDQTMVPDPKAAFAQWVDAREPVTQDWLVWVGPGKMGTGYPFTEIVAARSIPELIDGGSWKMIVDESVMTYGPQALRRYVEAELTDLNGAPARIAQINGVRLQP